MWCDVVWCGVKVVWCGVMFWWCGSDVAVVWQEILVVVLSLFVKYFLGC